MSLRFRLLWLVFLFRVMVAGAADASHFLWQVTQTGGKGEVFLLGSLHLCRKDMYPLPLAIEAAYRSSEAVALEVGLDDATQREMSELFVKEGFNPAGVSLSSQLEAETLRLLRTYQKAHGIAPEEQERLRPWMAAVSITLSELTACGLDPQLGIDNHFFTLARRDLKPVLAMETPRDQLALLSQLDATTADRMLRQSLTDARDMRRDVDASIEAWRKGDTEAIDRIMLQDFRQSEFLGLWNKIIVERNEGFAAHVQEYLARNRRVFVVVGAGHLVGPLSVPDLLTRRGYQVRQQ